MAETRRRVGANTWRAQRLLAGGAVGGHCALLTCVGLFLVLSGGRAAVWALIAGLVVIVFFTIGQAVQVMFAEASANIVFVASVTSYVLRVGGLGTLFAAMSFSGRITDIDPVAVAVTVVAVVVGWLGVEIWVFSRLRIPTYDPPEDRLV